MTTALSPHSQLDQMSMDSPDDALSLSLDFDVTLNGSLFGESCSDYGDITLESVLNGSLEHEALDESEYGIPEFDTSTLSLEEVLRECEEEAASAVTSPTGERDSVKMSVAGQRLIVSPPLLTSASHHSSRSRLSALPSCSTPDSNPETRALHLTQMLKISAQLSSANDHRIKAGVACSITMSDRHIAVGMQHELVLVFDFASEALYAALRADGGPYGQVACVAFAPDGRRLLAGYSRGYIGVFDLKTRRCLACLTGITSIGHAILHLKWLPHLSSGSGSQSGRVLCVDSGGSVYALQLLRKGIAVGGSVTAKSTCIFSGCKGEAVYIDSLRLGGQTYVIVISFTKLMVVRLRPGIRIVFSANLTGPPDSLPWFTSQSSRNDSETTLIFGRGHCISIASASLASNSALHIDLIAQIDLPYLVVALLSLGKPGRILVLDEHETVHLWRTLNPSDIYEEEQLSIQECDLTVNVSDWQNLIGGGNVSRALSATASRACYHSFTNREKQLYILGRNSLWKVDQRSWLERIRVFTSTNDFASAIKLCLQFFESNRRTDDSTAAVEREARWRSIVADQCITLMGEYLDYVLDRSAPVSGQIDALARHYVTALQLIFLACQTINRLDYLLFDVYERLRDQLARSMYLECLHEAILAQEVSTHDLRDEPDDDSLAAQIPPAMLQELWTYLEGEGLFPQLEQCILRMDMCRLDIHQVMTLCQRYRLYDAIIFIHTQALHDYVTPLANMVTELLKNLGQQNEALSDETIRLGNKTLLYLCCCLCGRRFPGSGELPSSEANRVVADVYEFLTTSAHAKSGVALEESTEKDSRVLFAFMKFDCVEFLNALTMAFQQQTFRDEERGLRMCQRLLDRLIDLTIASHFDYLEVSTLFSFICRQLIGRKSLRVRASQMRTLLETLATSACDPSVTEAQRWSSQQSLLELMNDYSRSDDVLQDYSDLLRICTRARFRLVCEHIHIRRREFADALDCYLNSEDPDRELEAFPFLRRCLSGQPTALMQSELMELKRRFKERIAKLAAISVRDVADVIAQHYDDDMVMYIVEKGVLSDLVLSQVLAQMWNIVAEQQQLPRFCADFDRNETVFARHVELQAIHSPQGIVELLRNHSELRTEELLTQCRHLGAGEAVVFLLESFGRFSEAFEYMEGDLYTDASLAAPRVLAFLERNSGNLQPEIRDSLWFDLLKALLQADNTNHIVSSYVQQCITSMIAFADPSKLLDLLLQEREGTKAVNDFAMFQSIFANYDYQRTIHSCTLNMIRDELYQRLATLLVKRASPIRLSLHSMICSFCSQSFDLTDSSNRPIFFHACSRVFHSLCLKNANSYRRGKHSELEWLCLHCNAGGGSLLSTPVNCNEQRFAQPVAGGFARLRRERLASVHRKREEGLFEFDEQDAASAPLNLCPPPRM